jgi:hypothetical protein
LRRIDAGADAFIYIVMELCEGTHPDTSFITGLR